MWKYEKYSVNKECLPKNDIVLYNKPILLVTLFSVYLICSFQNKCSSNETPRNFIDSTLCTSLSFIGVWYQILPFLVRNKLDKELSLFSNIKITITVVIIFWYFFEFLTAFLFNKNNVRHHFYHQRPCIEVFSRVVGRHNILVFKELKFK